MATRDQALGENIRRLRGNQSQQWLADEMRELGHDKWSQATVWSVEKGTRPLRVVEAMDLVQILRVPHFGNLLESAEEFDLGFMTGNVIRRIRQFREAAAALLEEQATLAAYLERDDVDWSKVDAERLDHAQALTEFSLVDRASQFEERWKKGEKHG